MVRTRNTRSNKSVMSASSLSSDGKSESSLLSDFKKQSQERLKKLDQAFQLQIDKVQNDFEMLLMSIPLEYHDMPFSVFLKECGLEASEKNCAEPGYESFLQPGVAGKAYATSTVRKDLKSPPTRKGARRTRQTRQRSTLCRSISEDNLTGLENASIGSTTTTKTRRTRSVSANRDASIRSIYQTPANNKRVLTAVTPKADLATAIVKRYARQGEVAMSLTGSPLMIPSATKEVSLTLPVADGEVYAIVPSDTFAASPVPPLTQETREQILLLRKNLDRLLHRNK